MLKVDPSLTAVAVGREQVVALHESVNQPLVNIPGVGTAPTAAYLVGSQGDRGQLTLYVVLRQRDTGASLVYVSEPRGLSADQFRVERNEAVRFAESMGFVMEDLRFRDQGPADQEQIMQRLPIFRGRVASPPTLELFEEVRDEDVSPVSTGEQPAPMPSSPPGRAAEAMFGGIDPARAEAFRRAGLMPATRSSVPAPAGGPSPVDTGPVKNPASPQRTSRGVTAVGQGGQPSAPPSVMGIPSTPPGALPVPSAVGSMRPPPERGATSASPRPPPQAALQLPQGGLQEADVEGLARLGRLLSTFCLLGALLTGADGCKTTPQNDEQVEARVQSGLDLGNQQLAEGLFPDAIRSLTDVLKEAPENRDAHYGAGLAYMNLGRSEDAERHFRKAIAADPAWSVPKNSLATLLVASRRCEEAEALLGEVLKDIFYPTPEFAEHNLARVEECLGKRAAAVKRLEALVLKRPMFCLAYLTLADLSLAEKKPQLTIETCEGFRRRCEEDEQIKSMVSPENACLCYLRKGLAQAQLGDVEGARQSFSSCRSDGAYGQECRRSLEMLHGP